MHALKSICNANASACEATDGFVDISVTKSGLSFKQVTSGLVVTLDASWLYRLEEFYQLSVSLRRPALGVFGNQNRGALAGTGEFCLREGEVI